MRFLCFVLFLILASCDSVEVTPFPPQGDEGLTPEMFVGTWSVEDAWREERVTLTADQDVPLFDRPARGGFTVTGEVIETFLHPHFYVYEPSGERRSFRATNIPGSGWQWGSGLTADRSRSGDTVAVSVTIERDDFGRRYVALLSGDDRNAVTFGRLHVDIDSVVVPD